MKGSAKLKAAEPAPSAVEVDEDVEPEHELVETDGEAASSDTADGKKDPKEKLPRALQQIQDAENADLADWLGTIGPQGSFRVAVSRTKPEVYRDPVTGEEHAVRGHLATLQEAVSEDQIKRDYGGGTYDLRVTKKNAKGSFVYAANRVIVVAGDPKVHRTAAPSTTPASPQATDNAGVVRAALEMTRDLAEKSAAMAARPHTIDATTQLLFDQMREQHAASQREVGELRRQLATVMAKEPPKDEFRDRMMATFIDADNSRITALRAQYESEIRTCKESHSAELRQVKDANASEIRRLEERHDRTVSDLRQAHDRQVDSMRSGYEREIAAIRASHDVAITASKSTHEVQVHTLQGDIKRLERDNGELRDEVKELRARKDKTIMETIKEAKTLKEALLDGEEGGDGSTFMKVAEAATPMVMGVVERLTNRGQTQQPIQAQPVARAPAVPQIVRDPKTGGPAKVVQQSNGQVMLIPLKRKPKVILTDSGAEIQAPQVEPEQIKMLVPFLEAAFAGGQDPAVFAQSARSQVPEPIIAWIKANTTDQVSGVDLFMRKVANLPGESPLMTLAGKKWLRQVGNALIGDPGE